MTTIPLIAAFLAGLLSFVSPCVLPLTPAYIARLVGPGVWQAGKMEEARERAARRMTTLHALAFVLGFTVAFVALGATASELGALLSGHQLALREVGGVVLVLMGAQVAGLVRIPGLSSERRLALKATERGYPASFVIGLIFALGWTPCVGPILAGILALAAQAGGLGGGALLLAVYSLGLGLPFLALGVAFDQLTPLLKRLTPHMRLIELVSGGLLAAMGVVIFFNWLLVLNTWAAALTAR